ncbi:phage tail protein [Glutamicibacter protophormiae]|uniref:phage tail protein n=1 Tax=Glutamicibacter protophormiae TaxID=37930 RepID=UPI003A8DB1AE
MMQPLPAYNFYIALAEAEANFAAVGLSALSAVVLGGFSEAAGLDSEIQVEERRAGGVNDRVYQFPGAASFPHLVLTRGMGFGEDLYLWHEQFLKGKGVRRHGMVFLADENHLPIKAWKFENGIPVKWSGPALNAGSSALAIEKLEIAHERMGLVLSPGKALSAAAENLGV